jgi:hypothetical protein
VDGFDSKSEKKPAVGRRVENREILYNSLMGALLHENTARPGCVGIFIAYILLKYCLLCAKMLTPKIGAQS